MARTDTMGACRTHNNKRYLVKDQFFELDRLDRVEATLWLVWPHAMRAMHINKIAHVHQYDGGALTRLEKQDRIVRTKVRGFWRFKPWN